MENVYKIKKMYGITLFMTLLFVLLNIAFIPSKSIYAATITYNRGVNIAGADFAADKIPGIEGTDYTFNDEATYNYFANKGFNIFRVPVLWERLQPTLNGALDTNYLNGLKMNITWAKNHGGRVIIDIHSYGRYKGQVIDTGGATTANFCDLWLKLSNQFKNELGVYAYDLMNEPHDMQPALSWNTISQTTLTAIRDNGDNKLIMIEGSGWAGAHNWQGNNGTAVSWITDPANNFMYEAHCYFDYNNSGAYTQTYDQELASNPNLALIGRDRVMDFITWCENNNVRGYLGEFGVPKNDSRWLTVLDNFLTTLDQHGFDATYWAGGTWWGPEELNVQPTNNFATDAPQMNTLLAHMPGTVDVTPPQEILLDDFSNASYWATDFDATMISDGNIGTVTCGGSQGYGQMKKVASYNLDDFPLLKINVTQLSEGAKWALKIWDTSTGGQEYVIQYDSSNRGEFKYNIKDITGLTGTKTLKLELTIIGGSGKTANFDYIKATADDTLNPEFMLDDFSIASNWTTDFDATMTSDGNIGTETCGGSQGYGQMKKVVTYNLDDLPLLKINVTQLSVGAKWAFKILDTATGGQEFVIQSDSTNRGESKYNIKDLTSWTGTKTLKLELTIIGGNGKTANFDYIKVQR